jgi:hypothetical protein
MEAAKTSAYAFQQSLSMSFENRPKGLAVLRDEWWRIMGKYEWRNSMCSAERRLLIDSVASKIQKTLH